MATRSVLNTQAGGQHFVALGVVFMLLLARSASAHEADVWPFVTVSCDPRSATAVVMEADAKSESAIPKQPGVRGLDALLKLEQVGDDEVQYMREPWVEKCKLGRSRYAIHVEPYLYNTRIQGMCGAAAPSARLTIYRNTKLLVRGLILKINCLYEGDIDSNISKVSLFEKRAVAVFEVTRPSGTSERDVAFRDLPELGRQGLVSSP